jgi:hypothetical protein
MTLNQIVAIAGDATFGQQVKAAAVAFSLAALNANPTAYGAADQAKWGLASNTIADGCTLLLPRYVWAVANSNAGTFVLNDTTNQNDALIQNAISNLWHAIALVNAGMKVGA